MCWLQITFAVKITLKTCRNVQDWSMCLVEWDNRNIMACGIQVIAILYSYCEFGQGTLNNSSFSPQHGLIMPIGRVIMRISDTSLKPLSWYLTHNKFWLLLLCILIGNMYNLQNEGPVWSSNIKKRCFALYKAKRHKCKRRYKHQRGWSIS